MFYSNYGKPLNKTDTISCEKPLLTTKIKFVVCSVYVRSLILEPEVLILSCSLQVAIIT